MIHGTTARVTIAYGIMAGYTTHGLGDGARRGAGRGIGVLHGLGAHRGDGARRGGGFPVLSHLSPLVRSLLTEETMPAPTAALQAHREVVT